MTRVVYTSRMRPHLAAAPIALVTLLVAVLVALLVAGPAAAGLVPERPASAGFIDSTTPGHDIRVHYEDAVQPQIDAAAELLAALDQAWTNQVDVQGWRRPMPDDAAGGSDAYDAYVGFVPSGVFALTVSSGRDGDGSDGRHGTPVFLLVDEALTGEALQVVAHHEFAHACQFATDASESVLLFEASAVYQEVLAVPSALTWTEPLAVFQRYPAFPVFADSRRLGAFEDDVSVDLYEYGAVLFAMYLEEVHGQNDGTLLRALWEASVQPDATVANEPDWLDALPQVAGVSVDDALLDFATWRVLVGAWAIEGDGPGASAVIPTTAELVRFGPLAPSRLDGQALVFDGDGQFDRTFEGGCATVEVQADDGPLPLHVVATSMVDGGRVGLATVVGDPYAHTATRAHDADGVVDVEVPEGERVVIAACALSITDADGDLVPAPIELRVLRTDVEFEDAGTAADAGDEEDAGVVEDAGATCACQGVPVGSTGAGPYGNVGRYAGIAIPLLGLAMFAIRTYRSRKRARLYRPKR